MPGLWEKTEPYAWWLIRLKLRNCPSEHQQEVAAEVESAIREVDEKKIIDHPKAFTKQVAQNKIADHFKKHPISLESVISGAGEAPDFSSQVDTSVAVEEILQQYERKDPQAVALFRQWLQGRTQTQVASDFGISQTTVNRKIDAVRGELKKHLQ